MKQLKYWLMALLAVLTFASCDDLLNNDDNDEDKNPAWTDYFSMKVTRCERFGDNLLVNFDLKNIGSITVYVGKCQCLKPRYLRRGCLFYGEYETLQMESWGAVA